MRQREDTLTEIHHQQPETSGFEHQFRRPQKAARYGSQSASLPIRECRPLSHIQLWERVGVRVLIHFKYFFNFKPLAQGIFAAPKY